MRIICLRRVERDIGLGRILDLEGRGVVARRGSASHHSRGKPGFRDVIMGPRARKTYDRLDMKCRQKSTRSPRINKHVGEAFWSLKINSVRRCHPEGLCE